MTKTSSFVVVCAVLGFGCVEQTTETTETTEIVDNLVKAGFPADDIKVVSGIVYAGRDAEVSLAASREMLAAGDSPKEQYRTANLVSKTLSKICVDGSTLTGAFSTALDLAIQNYEEQPLSFAMARTPSAGCSFTIQAVIDPAVNGGLAGFPSGGLPFGTIRLGTMLSAYSVDTIEHVITHELGHTIGFRHSDYYNRSISCNTGGNEGDAGIGAILIPGTPSGAAVGGSVMNSCFRSTESGEFTSSDVTALRALYNKGASSWLTAGDGHALAGDFNGDGRDDWMRWDSSPLGWTVCLSNGSNAFTNCSNWLPGVGDGHALAGDFNGDGRTDWMRWDNSPLGWTVCLSNGSNAFTNCSNWLPGAGDGHALAGDFNGDGRDDWMRWDSSPLGWTVCLSNGSNAFTNCSNWLPGAGDGHALAGDFNGDGRDDWMRWDSSPLGWTVCLSNGSNAFTGCGTAIPGISDSTALVGDFDGNGRADISTFNGPSSWPVWLR
jgi:dual-action HEIGH metallo-peptidase/VCBS repeat protein